MDKDILDGLKNFEAVWKRVQDSKAADDKKALDAKLMPRRDKRPNGRRFPPPRG